MELHDPKYMNGTTKARVGQTRKHLRQWTKSGNVNGAQELCRINLRWWTTPQSQKMQSATGWGFLGTLAL